MKKVSTVAAARSRKISGQKLTIGLDLGDRWSWYCVLDESGAVLLEQRLSTTATAMREAFGRRSRCRMALETGMHSPLVSRLHWPAFDSQRAEPQGDNQMAAPAETRTPNLHRADMDRSSRVRMEAWRQWLLGGEKTLVQPKTNRIHLTPTGLLVGGDYTQNPVRVELRFP